MPEATFETPLQLIRIDTSSLGQSMCHIFFFCYFITREESSKVYFPSYFETKISANLILSWFAASFQRFLMKVGENVAV